MTPEQFKRVENLFERALEQMDHERASFIEREAPDDAVVRQKVERMFREDRRADRFLATPVFGSNFRLGDPEVVERVLLQKLMHSASVRVVERISEGGVGRGERAGLVCAAHGQNTRIRGIGRIHIHHRRRRAVPQTRVQHTGNHRPSTLLRAVCGCGVRECGPSRGEVDVGVCGARPHAGGIGRRACGARITNLLCAAHAQHTGAKQPGRMEVHPRRRGPAPKACVHRVDERDASLPSSIHREDNRGSSARINVDPRSGCSAPEAGEA